MRFTEARFKKWTWYSAARFLRQGNKPGKSILFAVYLRDQDNKWIGNVRLFNWHSFHRTAEISFLFFDSSEWNKGFAREAIESILTYSNINLGVRRIFGDYYEPNFASGKLFSKLGFSIEGRAPQHFLSGERFVDSIRVGRILNGK
jgi:ribosomal-protein-alanine N-acetyltransferase